MGCWSCYKTKNIVKISYRFKGFLSCSSSFQCCWLGFAWSFNEYCVGLLYFRHNGSVLSVSFITWWVRPVVSCSVLYIYRALCVGRLSILYFVCMLVDLVWFFCMGVGWSNGVGLFLLTARPFKRAIYSTPHPHFSLPHKVNLILINLITICVFKICLCFWIYAIKLSIVFGFWRAKGAKVHTQLSKVHTLLG